MPKAVNSLTDFEFNLILNDNLNLINERLSTYTSHKNLPQRSVINAMEYSLSAGGKRIRPVLMLEFYKLFGGKSDIVDIACAIEMIHTFSLIHDDLPCMDNDDFRRGKPSCHKQFDEATALLAGDALSVLPFEIIANQAVSGHISTKTAVVLCAELAEAVGVKGMIGGQVLDLLSETCEASLDQLCSISDLKTGAIIKAACRMGAILADADETALKNASEYAENLGLAFQIKDDILDVCGDEKLLGKPVGSDKKRGKTTFVDLLDISECSALIDSLTEKAVKAIKNYSGSGFLIKLAKTLCQRTH